MAVIVYRRYSFQPPAPISNEQFEYFKYQIAANPAFEIAHDGKTSFSSKYRKNIRWLLIGLFVLATAIMLFRTFAHPGEGYGWLEIVLILLIVAGGATVFGTVMQLFLEGPSMATMLTNRRFYFYRMKHAIKQHGEYAEFYAVFYGDGKKVLNGGNEPFRQEALLERKQEPASMDKVLTMVFYRIDQHLWWIILLGFGIFLVKKYVIK